MLGSSWIPPEQPSPRHFIWLLQSRYSSPDHMKWKYWFGQQYPKMPFWGTWTFEIEGQIINWTIFKSPFPLANSTQPMIPNLVCKRSWIRLKTGEPRCGVGLIHNSWRIWPFVPTSPTRVHSALETRACAVHYFLCLCNLARNCSALKGYRCGCKVCVDTGWAACVTAVWARLLLGVT